MGSMPTPKYPWSTPPNTVNPTLLALLKQMQDTLWPKSATITPLSLLLFHPLSLSHKAGPHVFIERPQNWDHRPHTCHFPQITKGIADPKNRLQRSFSGISHFMSCSSSQLSGTQPELSLSHPKQQKVTSEFFFFLRITHGASWEHILHGDRHVAGVLWQKVVLRWICNSEVCGLQWAGHWDVLFCGFEMSTTVLWGATAKITKYCVIDGVWHVLKTETRRDTQSYSIYFIHK